MSLIRRKFYDKDTYKTFDTTTDTRNNLFPHTKRPQSQNKQKTPLKYALSSTTKIDQIQVSPLLKNLKKREILVQAENIQKARNLKEKLIDPKQLQQEYNNLIERYRYVKERYTMRPCKIPRSGIDIYDEGKKRVYQVLTID